jgi:hypothetical protein
LVVSNNPQLANSLSNYWKGNEFGKVNADVFCIYTLKVILQDGTVLNEKGSVNLFRKNLLNY